LKKTCSAVRIFRSRGRIGRTGSSSQSEDANVDFKTLIKWGNSFMRWHTRRHSYTARHRIRSASHFWRQRDYGWGLLAGNPYRAQPTFSGRLKFKLWLSLSTTVALLGILLYHPFFHIQKIIVAGQERLTESEIKEAAAGIMNTRRFGIFPGRSYLSVDVAEVKDILREKFPLQSISVWKTFPQELRIILEEKLSTIIYDNGKQYSYLGLDGKVVEIAQNVTPSEWRDAPASWAISPSTTAPTSTESLTKAVHVPDVGRVRAELGNYPIVYDTRRQEASVNQTVLKPQAVQSVIAWWQFFSKQTNVPVAYFIIADEGGAGEVITEEGWRVLVQFAASAAEQTEALQLVLKEKITDRQALKLIDLRFPGRVYWE